MQGSIVALVTPFDDHGQVDTTALRSLIERHIVSGTDAIVVCATTGEAPTLSAQEQREVIEESVRIAARRIPIIAGTGTYATGSSVEKTRDAQKAGADACLVVFPYYNRPTPIGIQRHIEEIARVGMPLIPYHHPGRTGVRLSAQFLAALMALPEVVAIKDCSGDMDAIIQLISMTDKPVLTGDDVYSPALIAVGGKGVISVLANVIPKEWKEMIDLCLRGNFSAARDIFYRFYPLYRAMALETNPQCVKYAVGLLGLCRDHLRLPLLVPQDVVQEEIRQEMGRLGLLTQSITAGIG